MNDEAAEAQRARVKALHDRWVDALGLGWWEWSYEWHRGAIPTCDDSTLFLITVRFEYQQVYLRVNLTEVSAMDDGPLESAFCHELGHVYTLPLKLAASRQLDADAMTMLEEHQATAIGRSLRWLRDSLAKDQVS